MVFYSVIISKNPALQAVWFYYSVTPGYKPEVMKISPFRTSTQVDLKSQNFITAGHRPAENDIKKKKLPVRQDKLKNENNGSAFDSH